MYRFKFYFNAKHYVTFKDGHSSEHPHTWEIALFLIKSSKGLTQFSEIEKEIQDYIGTYNNTTLNDIKPFDEINPSMENIGHVIYNALSELLGKGYWELEHLEISENPTRTYFVTNVINLEVLKEPQEALHTSEKENNLQKSEKSISDLNKIAEDNIKEKNNIVIPSLSSDYTSKNSKKKIQMNIIKRKLLNIEFIANIFKLVKN